MIRLCWIVVIWAAAVGCGGRTSSRPVMTRISVSPTPTRFVLETSSLSKAGAAILESIASDTPPAMPPNPSQKICLSGTTVAITANARPYRYGPCTLPPSIEHLRRAFLAAENVPVQGSTTVGASGWKAVLNDWYDGHLDKWHPCGAVLEALRHLPDDPMIYSTVKEDLQAYARGVC